MFMGIRIRIMVAALVFAVGWALGVVLHGRSYILLSIICLILGSIALAYLVWEYHKAWRLRPTKADSGFVSSFRNWPGISISGAIVRPEYISAAFILTICALGIYRYLLINTGQVMPISESPPAVLMPESKPFQ